MSNINSVKIGSTTYPIISQGIPYGIVDSTSTATAFTASIPGITEYTDGTTMLLKNGVITSAAGFTIDINGLGAKPVYSNMSAATAESTIFNINYTMLFVYDSTRIEGPHGLPLPPWGLELCWECSSTRGSGCNQESDVGQPGSL